MLPTSIAPTATIAMLDPVEVRFRVITLRLFSPVILGLAWIKRVPWLRLREKAVEGDDRDTDRKHPSHQIG